MIIRYSSIAGSFYPNKKSEITNFIDNNISEIKVKDKIVGGIVPHAGWVYSGYTALKVYSAIKYNTEKDIDTFIIFGTPHSYRVKKHSIFPKGVWNTPLGNIEIDEELSAKILAIPNINIISDENAHQHEHSIEVQIPFIQHLFPEAKIVPILCLAQKSIIDTGKKISKLLSTVDKNVIMIGSSDLTHYGPRFDMVNAGIGFNALEFTKKNDSAIINKMIDLKDDQIIDEAKLHRNACGSGAIAITLSAVKEMQSKGGALLEYTTSFDIFPTKTPIDIVGYAGIIFII